MPFSTIIACGKVKPLSSFACTMRPLAHPMVYRGQAISSNLFFRNNLRDIGVVSLKTWRISDQVARHKLLIAGLGWCGMPEPIVHADIESGRLVRSNLRDWRG